VQEGELFKAKMGISVYIIFALWIIIGIILLAYLLYWVDASTYSSEASDFTFLLILIFLTMVLAPIVALLYMANAVKIIIKEDSLYVKGLMGVKYDIPYSSIRGVREVKDAVEFYYSMTASSMYSIEIRYGQKGNKITTEEKVNIAPARKEEFLAKLESKLPNPGVYTKSNNRKEDLPVTHGSANYTCEEANALGKLSLYLMAATTVVLIAALVVIIIFFNETIATLLVYPLLIPALIVLFGTRSQAKKVQEAYDGNDGFAVKTGYKKGKTIGFGLFIMSVSIIIAVAALVIIY